MKNLLAIVLALSLPAFAQAANLSALAAPSPIPTAVATAPSCPLGVSDAGGPPQFGAVSVAVGDALTFSVTGVPAGAPNIISVNGKFFYNQTLPATLTADEAGQWLITFETPGCSTQALTITAH